MCPKFQFPIVTLFLPTLQVCTYHRSYYRPDNLCLIVAGQVEPGQLFQALAPVEEKILTKASENY